MRRMTWYNGMLWLEDKESNFIPYTSSPLAEPDHESRVYVGDGEFLDVGKGSPGYATMQKLISPPFFYKLVKSMYIPPWLFQTDLLEETELENTEQETNENAE